MAYIKDWMMSAADDIFNGEDTSVETIYNVIARHCPFKRDTAYKEIGPEDWPNVIVPDQNEEV